MSGLLILDFASFRVDISFAQLGCQKSFAFTLQSVSNWEPRGTRTSVESTCLDYHKHKCVRKPAATITQIGWKSHFFFKVP